MPIGLYQIHQNLITVQFYQNFFKLFGHHTMLLYLVLKWRYITSKGRQWQPIGESGSFWSR